ncbi:oxidoreductase [Alcanivorax xiamenensis]|uniref:Oxidoreductase n=1 Tax=Alcanivorax xiamenensis TaxID=1177156 RepID=A0ABQ6YAG9_9GAMM|nr:MULTISPECIES: NAD-dependent epimerase/dehydratase family protein [Alcanivorax]KAF0806857.1 oxidoreductase [Alcanivorax xiamenensis]
MPSAFITGARGFLGCHIARLLVEQGWQVTALLRPGSDGQALREAGMKIVHAPLSNATELTLVMPPAVDAVFHVAGNTSLWRRRRDQQYQDNVMGTRAVVTAALRNQAGRLIHTSSISAWGQQDGIIHEEIPSNAANDWIGYNRTKYLAEEEVRDGARQGLSTVILNPCAIIGAGDTHNWSQMISLIDQRRLPGVPPGGGNFGAVEEVARAHLAAWDAGRDGHNYILAGVEASFLELAQTIGRLLGRPAPRKVTPRWALGLLGQLSPIAARFSGNEPRLTPEKVALISTRSRVSGAKAVRELGFDDQVPLEIMLRRCIDWMRAEGMLSVT